MITQEAVEKTLNVAFIKEILNKKKESQNVSLMSRALLWCKPCSHELGSSIPDLCPGPARASPRPPPPPPAPDPVGNAIKELSPHSHSQALPPPLPQYNLTPGREQVTRAEKDLSNYLYSPNKHKTL